MRENVKRVCERINSHLLKVNFNEPTSILQRMVEDMLYVDLLERAGSCETSLEELAFLAVYSCSVYGTTAVSARVGKPFNPLLGETFECDRRAELGWRVFIEQVGCYSTVQGYLVEPA